ncbi:VanZ family protein [Alloiococcus sp. CFN-8]|uniref:VanZ family protein n=1 Tax=Alloiococcus sp. CFN-8 TaxID=3416081 RepID=UPI003CEA5671
MHISKDNLKGKLIAAVLLLAWMVVIFVFSAMPAEVSDEKSRLIVNILEALGLNTEGTLADLANHLVRKSAHFIEYALLYLLALNLMRYYFTFNKAFLISLAVVFLYACTDEFHQLFVPGRAGRFSDVMIDTAGGFTTMVLTKVVAIFKKK